MNRTRINNAIASRRHSHSYLGIRVDDPAKNRAWADCPARMCVHPRVGAGSDAPVTRGADECFAGTCGTPDPMCVNGPDGVSQVDRDVAALASGPEGSPFRAFYHVACMGNWRVVFEEQCSLFDRVGLRPTACVLGSTEDVADVAARLPVAYSSSNIKEFELPTLHELWKWCRGNPTGNVLYLHTKGVSKPRNAHLRAYRRLMQAVLVEPWRTHLEKLKDRDAIGVDWRDADKPFFAGNFWIARASWIRELQAPLDYQRDDGPPRGRAARRRRCAETWLASKEGCRIESLCGRNLDVRRGSTVFIHLARATGKSRLCFLHVPRTGGTSIRRSLKAIYEPFTHVRLRSIPLSSTDFLFTSLRNPWARLVSAWHYLKAGGINWNDKNDAEKYLSGSATFQEFLDRLSATSPVLGQQHFRPQMYYIEAPSRFSIILRCERLGEDWRRLHEMLGEPCPPLQHANKSRHRDYRTYYDSKGIETVREIYRADVEAGGYQFDAAPAET